MRDAELARLHADLVMNGHITEAEFWEGREVSSASQHVHLPRGVVESESWHLTAALSLGGSCGREPEERETFRDCRSTASQR